MNYSPIKFPAALMFVAMVRLRRLFTFGGGNIDSAQDVSCDDLALFR